MAKRVGRPVLTDQLRAAILDHTLAGKDRAGIVGILNVGRDEVEAVQTFNGYPNELRMRAALQRLRESLVVAPAAPPAAAQPEKVTGTVDHLGMTVRDLIQLGRRSKVNRTITLADRLQSVAAELGELLEVEHTEHKALVDELVARERAEGRHRSLNTAEAKARAELAAPVPPSGVAARHVYQRELLARCSATAADVRAWAAREALPVAKGGTIPRAVLDAFEAHRGAGA